MAACGETPEPGRPPEAIARLRKCDPEGAREAVLDANINLERCYYSTKDCKEGQPKLDLRTNCRATLRKVFFKRHSNGAANGNLNNNNSASLDAHAAGKKADDEGAARRTLITTVSQSVDETRARKRYSFHQDVEEALNSLLWQPYEYQRSNREKAAATHSLSSSSAASASNNNSERSDGGYDRRTSACSSSCSSLSSSSGLESSNNGTHRSGNTADLHLLVNNLRPRRLGQSLAAQRSHGGAERERRAPLLPRAYLPSAAAVAVNAQRPSVPEPRLVYPAHRTSATNNNNNNCAPRCIGAEFGYQCDVRRSPTGDTMRVEIQPPPIKSIITSGTCTTPACNGNAGSNANSGGGGGGGALLLQMQDAAAGASIPPPPRSARSTARNLSSVNVVGLPHNHPRQNSVPATLTIAPTSAARTLVPNHSRNISEPYRGGNSFISGASPGARIGSNSNSNINNNNSANNNGSAANVVSLFNHQRLNAPQVRAGHPHGQQPIAFTSSTTVGTTSAGELIPCGTSGGSASAINNNSDVSGVGAARASNNNNSRVPLNVSNVNVNYYRAVPVNVVSAVPTIHCLNTSGGGGGSGSAATSCTSAAASSQPAVTTASPGTISDASNVSSVNIVQAMPLSSSSSAATATATCTEVIVHSAPAAAAVRTFTSTEAQTDEPAIASAESATASREQRRRERRERRHQRRLNVANHRHASAAGATSLEAAPRDAAEQMPDLLSSALPPPYNGAPHHHPHQLAHPHPHPHPPASQPQAIMVPPGTLVQSLVPNSLVPNGLVPNAMVPFHAQVVPGQVPLVQAAGAIPVPVPSPTGFRFPLPANGFRRSRFSEDPPKSCCGLLAWRPGSLRWFIALIALVAVCCVLVGTALGAMGPSGRDHLTVSLLMIGVGIILVTVSGVAWRLTSHDASTCRSMLGLGSTESVEACPRRFVPRLPPSYGRPHHPYAAMMYPEFQYRPPPPSYQASMQEYRLRLLLLDRGNTPQIQAGLQNAVSPPPTYRSHSGSLLRVPLSNRRDASQSEYSCPPSYRSQNSSSRAAAMLQSNSIMHSREQSLSLSESNQGGSVVNVVNILSTNEEDIALDNITLDSLKLEPEEINPLKMLLKGSAGELEGTKDGNLVTIVQTNDQSPVIVTVSGSSHSDGCNAVTEISNEMEILAHL